MVHVNETTIFLMPSGSPIWIYASDGRKVELTISFMRLLESVLSRGSFLCASTKKDFLSTQLTIGHVYVPSRYHAGMTFRGSAFYVPRITSYTSEL
jgi:hypothetical protein